MKIRKVAAILLVVLSSFAAAGAPTKSDLETMYDKAFRAFDAGDYSAALKQLDAMDARQPDLAEAKNLRGVVYMREGRYDKAEAALRQALQIEPKFWNARFNLAEIPFLQKKWSEARNRFEALLSAYSDNVQGETAQLIQYKILLTLVLQNREQTVNWILNKFELSKDTPALYYSNAALALQHNNQSEAKEWISSAEKHFSPQLNKLFSESLYEVGWLEKPAGESHAALEISSPEDRLARMQADARANYELAERAFRQRDFDSALKSLDQAAMADPNQAPVYNLRGEILMEQGKLGEADTQFHKALEIDPKFRQAEFNLAQLALKQKEYGKARERFESLFNSAPPTETKQTGELIKYNVFLSLLLQGKDSQAQTLMDQFKFTGDTPALYYAQAAWAFKHGSATEAEDWLSSARKIYSRDLNLVFAEPFEGLGWIKTSEGAPTTGALAQAEAEATPAEGKPEMRFGEAEPLPAPVASANAEAATPVASAAPSAAPAVAAAASPAQAANSRAPVVAAASATPVAAAAVNQVISSAAVTPAATALAPERIREWTRPSLAETIDHAIDPHTMMVCGLFLAGILLLVWLIVQQMRQQIGKFRTVEGSAPLSLAAAGPPKLSLQLKASEPAVRTAVLPSAMIAAPPPATEKEPPPVVPHKVVDSVPSAPVRDEEEVSALVAPPATPERIPAAPEPTKIIPESVPISAEPETAIAEPVSPTSDSVAPTPEPSAAAPEPPVITPEPIFVSSEPAITTDLSKQLEEAPAAPQMAEAPVAEPQAEIAEPAPMLLPPVATEEPTTPAATVEPAAEAESIEAPKAEPIGQGQPIPQLTPLPATEAIMTELTESEPTVAPAARPPETVRPVPAESSIETPSFAPKIITTENTPLQPVTPVIMPETTLTPTTPAYRTPSSGSGVSVQQPSGQQHTAVQLTFSLEIASMQLTPTFKMSGLQLKPISKVVAMRLAPSQQPQPPMNLQITFEVASVSLAGGSLGTIRLTPSGREKPAMLSSSSFPITGLDLVSGSGLAPVQLTPSHQEQASVHLTAAFQIAAIEFSPLFEITAVVLNSTSRSAHMQLLGAGPSSIDAAPIFEIEKVDLSGGNEIGIIHVVPMPGGRPA